MSVSKRKARGVNEIMGEKRVSRWDDKLGEDIGGEREQGRKTDRENERDTNNVRER